MYMYMYLYMYGNTYIKTLLVENLLCRFLFLPLSGVSMILYLTSLLIISLVSGDVVMFILKSHHHTRIQVIVTALKHALASCNLHVMMPCGIESHYKEKPSRKVTQKNREPEKDTQQEKEEGKRKLVERELRRVASPKALSNIIITSTGRRRSSPTRGPLGKAQQSRVHSQLVDYSKEIKLKAT